MKEIIEIRGKRIIEGEEVDLSAGKYSLGGITAAYILDDRRPKKSDDPNLKEEDLRFPVKYRVTFMRKRYYNPSGIDLTYKEWKALPNTKKKNLIDTRELIQTGLNKIIGHIDELYKGEGFSFEALNNRLKRGMKNSILLAIHDRAETLKNNGQIGSSIWYTYSAKSIEGFTQRDLKFSDITVDWLNKFEKHLKDEDKSYTTISMYIRPIQAMMNQAQQNGIISHSQYPFGEGRYTIPTGTGRKMALTLEQIAEVLSYPLTTDTEKRCRDLWFFSYLCNGINMNDLLRLRYSSIQDGQIHFYRQKTIRKSARKKEITAELTKEMKDIIKKWGNPDKRPNNYIFPFLTDGLTPMRERSIVQNNTSLINKKMKAIGKALGYGNISTYWARHSYATVLKRSGANIAFISESLGHTDLKTTENYLASFEREYRIETSKMLTKFPKPKKSTKSK